jgi:hypothetical protein
MIISHARRFVILAPWKSASQTMRARLGNHCESPYETFFYFNEHLKRVVHQHITFADFSALPESRLGYRVAAFVRNPYDRAYSGFRQLQKDLEEQPRSPYLSPWIRRLVMAQLAENAAGLLRAGLDFNTWLAELDEGLIVETGRNTNFPLHPAHYWTHVAGKQAVGFVGRVERFEDDFGHLCRWLEIAPDSAMNVNVDGSDAELESGGYRHTAKMSPSSIRRIEELFAADFDLFGYERLSARSTDGSGRAPIA